MKAWPLIAVSAAAGAVGLLPVLPSSGGFEGDLILLLALLEAALHVHHRRGLFFALHLRRDRLRARSRAERLVQRGLSSGHRLHRRLAAYFPAGSTGRNCPPRLCAGWA